MINAISPSYSYSSTQWSKEKIALNKNYGIKSFSCGAIGSTAAISKSFIDENSISYKVVNLIEGIFFGLRSHFQYTIYSKDDDDLGSDKKERPLASNIGSIACFNEKYLNPILIPALVFIGTKTYNAYKSLCHLPNALWWRSRMCSERINCNLSHYALCEEIKMLFDCDLEERKLASNKIQNVLCPPLGLIGFFFSTIFTPLKVWNRFFGKENRVINMLGTVGNTTQHIAYFFRFTLPELWKVQRENKIETKILFTTGICGNIGNIFSPLVELVSEESNLKKIKDIYSELASGFTMAFFSIRRYFLGKKFSELVG